MKVYVVIFLQSYDGPIYSSVYATEAEAQSYIESQGGPRDQEWYEIIEEEI